MEESTAFLIESHLNDDPIAFSKIVARYHSLVFGVCMRFLRHHQDAEDMTQETFSRMAASIESWDSSRPIEPWLVTIAKNRCRSFLSQTRNQVVSGLAVEPVADSSGEAVAADSLREEIRLALHSQSETHRIAFELFHDHSLPYTEIAARLGCPVGTAKTWVHRARMALIEQLRERDIVVDRSPISKEANR